MTRSAAVRFLAVLIVAVLGLGLFVTATGTSGESGAHRFATLTLDGRAEVDGPAGSRTIATGDHGLAAGEHVELLAGEAVLAWAGAGSLELRAGPERGSRVEVGAVPVVEGGDVLVLAGDQELVVEAGGARLSLLDGAARISRATGTTFALYQGRAGLTSGGRRLEGGLPPLRQVVVTDTGMVPLSVDPLRFEETPDPWDRRFLGDALDLEATLDRRSTAFTTLLRDDFTPDVFFFQAVMPGLLHEPSFDQALLDGQDRPVGETLVGAAVALVGQGDDFATRWQSVFDLRGQGAGWGIVALDQGASRPSLLSTLDAAVERSPLLFAVPSPAPVFEPTPAPVRDRPTPAPLPAAPPVMLPVPSTPVPAPRPPTRPPAPVPAPSPAGDDDGVLEPVVDPLVDLLDDVLNGLGDLGGGLL